MSSDPEPAHLASIAAYVADAGLANLRAPLALDVATADWSIEACSAVVSINMVHVAPWAACRGLLAGAGRVLLDGGRLFLYGPFVRAGRPLEPSNAAFDRSLRAQNPDWGLRDLAAVEAEAGLHGLALRDVVEMPANNLSLVFEKA